MGKVVPDVPLGKELERNPAGEFVQTEGVGVTAGLGGKGFPE